MFRDLKENLRQKRATPAPLATVMLRWWDVSEHDEAKNRVCMNRYEVFVCLGADSQSL